MQAVIVAGGLATRMRPLTQTLPKSLLPIAGRPFIDYQLDLFEAGGVTEVVLCLGYLGDRVETHLLNKRDHHVRVVFSREGDQLLGTGGALKLAEQLLAPEFLVTWGDSYVRADHRALFAAHLANEVALVTMGVFHNQGAHDASNVEINGSAVLRYAKGEHDPHLEYIDAGLSVFRRSALAEIPEGEYSSLDTLFARWAVAGRMAAYVIRNRFYEIGSRTGYAEFEAFIGTGAHA